MPIPFRKEWPFDFFNLVYGSYLSMCDISPFFSGLQLEMAVHSAKYVNAGGPKRATSSQPHQRIASNFETVPSDLPAETTHHHVHTKSDSSDASKAVSSHDSLFLLPDLNSLPSEEDSGFEMLYGMSCWSHVWLFYLLQIYEVSELDEVEFLCYNIAEAEAEATFINWIASSLKFQDAGIQVQLAVVSSKVLELEMELFSHGESFEGRVV